MNEVGAYEPARRELRFTGSDLHIGNAVDPRKRFDRRGGDHRAVEIQRGG